MSAGIAARAAAREEIGEERRGHARAFAGFGPGRAGA